MRSKTSFLLARSPVRTSLRGRLPHTAAVSTPDHGNSGAWPAGCGSSTTSTSSAGRRVARLVKESRAAFERPEARELARKAGFEVVAGTPEELAARVAAKIPAVRELVDKAGIKPE